MSYMVNMDTAYKETYKGKLSKQTYKKIIKYFVDAFIEYVYAGHEVLLPSSLGSVYIKGRKYKVRKFENGRYNIPIDWEETYALWENCPECAERGEKIYQTNDHSDGVVYRIVFSNNQSKYRFRKIYRLVPVRTFKRGLAQMIKKGQKFYVSR